MCARASRTTLLATLTQESPMGIATHVPPRGKLLPDTTFYASPRAAMKAPVETLAYVALNDPTGARPDSMAAVDCDPTSKTYGQLTSRLALPFAGDELHHFGWNACSSALCPYAAHPHVGRRYLIVPGLKSSRIYILDTQPDPSEPQIVKIIEPRELIAKTGYSRPHTVHCGPDGIYMSALGDAEGNGPGGIFLLDHETFEPLGRWEIDRGPQRLAYDFSWHLGWDTMITSEWGTPNMVERGLQPQLLFDKQYGRGIHLWDLKKRTHLKALPVGENDQMVLELRPAHDPSKAYGFVGVVVSLENLSSSIWMWYREGDEWQMKKVIEIPAEPADPAVLPPMLKDFKAVPPLVTDINLSLDDRTLFVSCWGTGELRRYDVTDPFSPRLTGSVHLGGIARRTAHPKSGPLNGGPQMVELSRDGKRVYLTNSLYLSWDEQFYPDGIKGWLAKIDVSDDGLSFDENFFVDFGERRPHQVRLQGGDASSDSYCFP
jgi:selenium-binding protein 1